MSLYLFFDVGNTRLKWAAVESTQNPGDQQKKLWAYSGSISSKSLQSPEHRTELADYISKTLPKPVAIGFCCVAGQEAIDNLKSLFPQWNDLDWQELKGNSAYTGMRSQYQDLTKLGADRWVFYTTRATNNASMHCEVCTKDIFDQSNASEFKVIIARQCLSP